MNFYHTIFASLPCLLFWLEQKLNKTIILHQEGDGGKYNSGISIPTNNGLKWISGNNKSDVGRLYQWVTLILGMKPYHHEYKIMGLAPFANSLKKIRHMKYSEKF